MRPWAAFASLLLLTTFLVPALPATPNAEKVVPLPEQPWDVAVDGSGNVYSVGGDWGGPNGYDAWLRKSSADGAQVWFRWIGGSGTDEAYAVTVNDVGDVFVAGTTSSSDFPASRLFQSGPAGAHDVWAAKYSSSGTRQWAAIWGGSSYENVAAIDWAQQGTLVVVGTTASCDYPTYGSAWQPVHKDGCSTQSDTYVTKLTSNGASIVFSTFVGGTGFDTPVGVAVSRSTSSILVGGYTWATDYPTTANAYQRTSRGDADSYVFKLDPNGRLQYSTYFGGADADYATGLARDPSGNPVLVGGTYSTDLPTTSGAFQTRSGGGMECREQTGRDSYVMVPCIDSFVVKLAGDLSSLKWSTYLATPHEESVQAVDVDSRGAIYLLGETDSEAFPHVDARTRGSFDGETGGRMAFMAALAPTGNALQYSQTMGDDGFPFAMAVAARADGVTWHGLWTSGADFPGATEDDEGVIIRIGTPSSGAVFSPRGGNEWWVETYVGGREAGKVVSVQAKDENTGWTSLTRQWWGAWAGTVHVEPGNHVTYRATLSDGRTFTSCAYDHPAANCTGSGGGGGAFDATFSSVKGNEWWIEAKVAGTEGVTAVHASINGGAWQPLTLRSWGAWAASYRAQEGSIVQLRATGASGATDLSGCYRWVAATPVECAGGGGGGGTTFDATFKNVRGNEWWIETDVTVAGGTLSGVDARVNGGAWTALEKKSYGSWAKSIHAPTGSTVEFRARAADGQTDVSSAYRWPPA